MTLQCWWTEWERAILCVTPQLYITPLHLVSLENRVLLLWQVRTASAWSPTTRRDTSYTSFKAEILIGSARAPTNFLETKRHWKLWSPFLSSCKVLHEYSPTERHYFMITYFPFYFPIYGTSLIFLNFIYIYTNKLLYKLCRYNYNLPTYI